MYITVLHAAILDPAACDTVARAIPGEFEPRAGHIRLHHPRPATPEALAYLRDTLPLDVNPLPAEFNPEATGLLVSDMDSTLINIECIDEIADFAGAKPAIAAITEAAMRGEIEFAESLTRRVAALKGVEESALQRVYEERLRPNPGAEALIEGLHERAIKVALVSGGFTFFTERLKSRLGLDFTLANQLEIASGRLTGKVVGGIVDARVKAQFLLERCEILGLEPAQAIAMGDGANDLEMMRVAGLGVAYRAKPRVQAEVPVVLNHSGLDAVLHLLDCETR